MSDAINDRAGPDDREGIWRVHTAAEQIEARAGQRGGARQR